MFHAKNILIHKLVLHFLNISLIHADYVPHHDTTVKYVLSNKKRKVLNVLYLCEINRKNTCLVLSSVITYNTQTHHHVSYFIIMQ